MDNQRPRSDRDYNYQPSQSEHPGSNRPNQSNPEYRNWNEPYNSGAYNPTTAGGYSESSQMYAPESNRSRYEPYLQSGDDIVRTREDDRSRAEIRGFRQYDSSASRDGDGYNYSNDHTSRAWREPAAQPIMHQPSNYSQSSAVPYDYERQRLPNYLESTGPSVPTRYDPIGRNSNQLGGSRAFDPVTNLSQHRPNGSEFPPEIVEDLATPPPPPTLTSRPPPHEPYSAHYSSPISPPNHPSAISKRDSPTQQDYYQSEEDYNSTKQPKLEELNEKFNVPHPEPKEEEAINAPAIQFTSFPIYPTVSTKVIASGFAHIDTYGATDPTNTLSNLPYYLNKEGHELELDLSENCIIFHPGSRNLRLGMVNDPFPKEIPHVIARKFKKDTVESTKEPDAIEQDRETKLADAIAWGEKEVMERLQASKRKPVHNAVSQVYNFNKASQPYALPEHNDPLREKWFLNPDEKDIIIGDDVLNFEDIKGEYKVRYPLKFGKLNDIDYNSKMEVRGDLEDLWELAITQHLGIPIQALEGFSVGLVIPDSYCPVYLSEAIDILLTSLGFYSVFVIQESVSATFGAGISHACVVDVGATCTTVSCVEDGKILSKSKYLMPYGGDDVTWLALELFRKSGLPYQDLDPTITLGWRVADQIKAQFVSYSIQELAVQLASFFVPRPNTSTHKYDLKVYDEGFIAAMLYFNPKLMDLDGQNKLKKLNTPAPWIDGSVRQWLDNVLDRIYMANPTPTPMKKGASSNINTGTPNASTPGQDDDMVGDIQDADDHEELAAHPLTDLPLPLDVAIAKAIRTCSPDEHTARRWYTSILISGGGAGPIPGFAQHLTARLAPYAPPNATIEVLASVRELDPRHLAWKGAQVFSKLDITQELQLNFQEWENKGLHALRDKVLFTIPMPWCS